MRELLRHSWIHGASLVTRDGVLVVNADERLPSPDSFSAMAAALMSAAETALEQLGDASDLHVTSQSESFRMLTVGATNELLLVVVAAASADPKTLLVIVDETARRLRDVMAEA